MKFIFKTIVIVLFALSSVRSLGKSIEAVLTFAEKIRMTDLAENVLNPNSDRYGIFYSPEEIRALVGPSDTDYKNLLDSLVQQGFSIVRESKSHLILTVRGDHLLFEKVFSTHIQFKNTGKYRNRGEIRIPSQLSLIANITGLDNTHSFKPRYRISKREYSTTDQPGILPAQIKTAYGMDALYEDGLSGKGQDIAIAAFMDFSLENVRTYYEKIGLSPIPNIEQITFDGKPEYDNRAAIETELDSELSAMIAPGANIHVFSSSQNSNAGELTVFNAILDDNRSKLVNYSWGDCETNIPKSHRTLMEKVFARAVAQGINILVASGDNGSDSCANDTVSAGWPNINPYVISVGGTSLKISDIGITETGWSGSGGGVSVHYKKPRWQNSKTPYAKRADPDIAFNSDPNTGEAIWTQENEKAPNWLVIGGTSMAAPQWVGFLALVNEARAEQGLRSLGYLNPILYRATARERSEIFRDITTGTNGVYSARRAWDAVTGWGSMNGEALLDYLLK